MLFLFSTASIITAAHTIHKRTKDVPCRNARAIIIVSLLPYASVLARFLEEFAWPTNAVWDVTRPLYFCSIHLQRHICKYVFKILGKKDFLIVTYREVIAGGWRHKRQLKQQQLCSTLSFPLLISHFFISF